MKQFFYLIWWYFQVKFLGKQKPLQTVLFINNECNLRCKHCCINKDKTIIKSYEQIKQELEYSYKIGSRFVDFEGGEPTLWHDKEKTFNDLVFLAKQIGFFSTTVTTNAQNSFDDIKADHIWVSLDGIKEAHDAIRGKGTFCRVIENIHNFGVINSKKVSVNMVINKLNENFVEETIRFVSKQPYIKSISLNFHMPYYATDDLCVEDKLKILDKIIKMKKCSYPIMNTLKGLEELKKPQTSKYCWITNFIMPDGLKYNKCQGAEYDLCSQCGLGMATEMKNLYKFSLETVFAGIKLRLFKNK